MKDIIKFAIGLTLALTTWHYSDQVIDTLWDND